MLTDTDPRPCHVQGTKPNACAAAHYRRIVENHVNLSGPWEGWRLAGRDLVSPDRKRISPERLRGLLFRQDSEARLARNRCKNGTPGIPNCSIVAIASLPGKLPARELFQGAA